MSDSSRWEGRSHDRGVVVVMVSSALMVMAIMTVAISTSDVTLSFRLMMMILRERGVEPSGVPDR
jgi:hypothetical protein